MIVIGPYHTNNKFRSTIPNKPLTNKNQQRTLKVYRTARPNNSTSKSTSKGFIMPNNTASPYRKESYSRPELPNVVRDIRTSADITQKDLARQAGLSSIFVLRAEQFLHVELSPALSVALSKIDPHGRSAEEISEAYHKGRMIQLRVNSEAITSNPYYRVRIRNALNYAIDHSLTHDQAKVSDEKFSHPFALFRTHLFTSFDMPTSQIKFCVFTGVHPTVLAAVERYEASIEHTISVALSVVLDMSPGEIATLKLLCDQAL
jgi:transcriptional regulator with XRE-family HTH domain